MTVLPLRFPGLWLAGAVLIVTLVPGCPSIDVLVIGGTELTLVEVDL